MSKPRCVCLPLSFVQDLLYEPLRSAASIFKQQGSKAGDVADVCADVETGDGEGEKAVWHCLTSRTS